MDALQQHGEFIAPKPGQPWFIGICGTRVRRGPRNGIEAAQRGAQPLPDLNKQFITCAVAEAVVEPLELVDIDE